MNKSIYNKIDKLLTEEQKKILIDAMREVDRVKIMKSNGYEVDGDNIHAFKDAVYPMKTIWKYLGTHGFSYEHCWAYGTIQIKDSSENDLHLP